MQQDNQPLGSGKHIILVIRIISYSTFSSPEVLATIVPEEFIEERNIGREICREYQKLVGTSQVNAGYRYVELVTQLPSYGQAFFDVKVDNNIDIISINYDFICHLDPDSGA